MSDDQRPYLSYLLRLWQEPATPPNVWRASLENSQTGELLGFGDVSQLFSFLEERTAMPSTHGMPYQGATGRRLGMQLQTAVLEHSDNAGKLEPQPHDTLVVTETDAMNRERAAQLVKQGFCVASFVRAVWVLWLDPCKRQAVEAIYRIKGERRIGRPMMTTLEAGRFIKLLDPDKIAPAVRSIFLNPEELESRFGMLCLIRAPIKRSAAQALPPDIVSQTSDGTIWLQNCVLTGSSPVVEMIHAMRDHGVDFPAVTSMNVSEQPEIVERAEAETFCREHGVPLVLVNPEEKHVAQGSFPIIEVGPSGVKLVREGHFPPYLFRYLLAGAEVDLSGAATGKYPLVNTHSEEEAARVSPYRLRKEITARLEGRG